jgi:bifunctional enzyme CysN/CysC
VPPAPSTDLAPVGSEVSELLRFCAIGSVDDGKSTLIGRLLADTKQLFDDQVAAIEEASRKRGFKGVELAFATDGLRAEREQGITIDVAYRYAQTPKRKFVIADCPGHEQYTRNMATGASTAELAVVVVDATRGLREQTRRHLCIAALMGVRRFVACVNKMDLVEWSQAVYDETVTELGELAGRLGVDELVAIPVSALLGDGVAAPSAAGWYRGPSLVEVLESVPVVGSDLGGGAARLPVQWVLRLEKGAGGQSRGYAGMLSGGPLRPGDAVVVLPSGTSTRVEQVFNFDGPVEEAWPGMSVTLCLADDLDVGRGDMIASSEEPPMLLDELDATVVWFSEKPLVAGSRHGVKHTTRRTPAIVTEVAGVVDVNTLEVQPATEVRSNGIGRVRVKVSTPLAADDYRTNRSTGSFVIVDTVTNATLGAGMIHGV